jgi:hypothetical protein
MESIAGPPGQTVWDISTGEEVNPRLKRRWTKQDQAMSQQIRKLDGQCVRCKKGKRKVCLVWPGSLPVSLTF